MQYLLKNYLEVIILLTLFFIIKNQFKQMADLSKLQAAVAAETEVDTAVETLLTTLVAEIKAAGTDQAALDALTSQMEANAAALSKAVTDNTPAANS